MTPEQEQFIEKTTQVIEQQGGQRIIGMILGALLIHERSELNAHELQDILHASRAAISQGCTTLEQIGFIEKVRRKGERKSYYRIREGMWEKITLQGVQKFTVLRETAELGLKVAPNDRLHEMQGYFQYWEEAYPRIIHEWQQRKKQP